MEKELVETKNIVVNVEPRHFAASSGWSHGPGKCPLQQALAELYPKSRIHVGAFHAVIDNFHYDIINWGPTGKENSFRINGDDDSDWPVERIDTIVQMAKVSLDDIPTVPVTLKHY